MKRLLMTFLTAFTLLISGSANADYPNGPVQFLIPWPPGDFEDILTRMIADEWKAETGMPASVVNRPGGGDGPFPGALEVLDAPADGSVIGSFVIGVPLVGPLIDIGIEEDSFEPVGIFLTYPFVLSWSMLESMSLGGLILGSKTPPVEEVIKHNKNGLLVNFFDHQAISKNINKILDDPMKFTSIRKEARKTIENDYDLYKKCLPLQIEIVEGLFDE